jgi:hypothetical protein
MDEDDFSRLLRVATSLSHGKSFFEKKAPQANRKKKRLRHLLAAQKSGGALGHFFFYSI